MRLASSLAGEQVVQNGTRHRWRKLFDEPCLWLGVMSGAKDTTLCDVAQTVAAASRIAARIATLRSIVSGVLLTVQTSAMASISISRSGW